MPLYDDEIDLRMVIIRLLRHWKIIILISFAVTLLAVVYTLLQARTYRATAKILLTRSRSVLTLSDDYAMLNEPVDTKSRLDALLSVAESDGVALATINSLGDSLPTDLQDIQDLHSMVNVTNRGDAVAISVEAENPDLAAGIANSWAQHSIQAINSAYLEDQSLAEIQAQMISAQETYETAQKELESFILQDPRLLLKQQLLEAERLAEDLSTEQAWKLAYYSQRIRDMERLLVQAEALKRQVEGGSESAAASMGDVLAVIKARADAFGIQGGSASVALRSTSTDDQDIPTTETFNNNTTSTNSELGIDIDITELAAMSEPAQTYIADLDQIIQSAGEELALAQENLQNLSSAILEGEGSETLEAVAAKAQSLKAQIEDVTAQETRLISRRDLTLQAYQALAQKETEIVNRSQVTNYANIASPAVAPKEPLSRGLITNAIIGGGFGLLLSVFGVLLAGWWRSLSVAGPGEPVPAAGRGAD